METAESLKFSRMTGCFSFWGLRPMWNGMGAKDNAIFFKIKKIALQTKIRYNVFIKIYAEKQDAIPTKGAVSFFI